MKMRKTVLNGLALLILLCGNMWAAVTYTPASPNVQQTVTFDLTSLFVGTVTWNFGDGLTQVGMQTMTHTYHGTGTYTVSATYMGPVAFIPTTETCTVNIVERRSITMDIPNPETNQMITFTAVNFFGTTASWDFGDGTTVRTRRPAGALVQQHAYSVPGTYTIRVKDNISDTLYRITRTVTVTQTIPTGSIAFTPAQPRIGQPVTFTAQNFQSMSQVRWDFGDGTLVTDPTPPNIMHTYNQIVTFTVRAYDGASVQVKATVTVRVYPRASITFTPDRPRIGEQVTFSANNFFSNTLIRWSFGDGAIINDNSPPGMIHSFQRAGVFQVRAYDDGGAVVTAAVTIQIYSPASIIFSPGDPRSRETVAFTAQNFFSNTLIHWEFGDGSIENDNSPPNINHIYANPGTYLVRAYDGGAGTLTAQTPVQIMPPRLLTHAPLQPRIGETVTFQAVNFLSPNLQWDFGDGGGMVQAGFQTSHVYNRRGIFTVTVMDTREGAPFPVTDTVSVIPSRGALAPFSISFVQLRFDDGRSYKVVNKNFAPLIGFGEIKYEGTGLFVAQWLVDGSPFRLISQPLIQAESILIDTGQIPGLPTLIPGIHELSLNIIQPAVDFQVPAIRYFVTADEGQRELMNLRVSTAQNLNEESIPVYSNAIEAPAEAYFIFKGTVRNENPFPLEAILLRIFLDDRLIDQIILRNIQAGAEREFETSIYNSSKEEKKIYIALYSLSDKKANLIYVKEMSVIIKK